MAYSPDGRELYFLGRFRPGVPPLEAPLDIWVTRFRDGRWTTAEMVPAPVSSDRGEVYPVVVGDGSLYFTSARDGGLGQTDIYRAQRRADGGFETPVNLGAPVNSPGVSDSGLRHTFIRPNWFMQNFSIGLFAQSIRATGHIYLPAADARVSFVDTRDIAAMAAAALTEDGHDGKTYTVTGGRSLTHTEVAGIVSDVSGLSVTDTAISDDDLRAAFAEEGTPEPLIEHFLSFFPPMRDGLYAPVSPDVPTVVGRSPITFEQHAREFADGWRRQRPTQT